MQMLYNTDSKNPGRRTLLFRDTNSKMSCGALIRYLRKEREYTPQRCLEGFEEVRAKNRDLNDEKTLSYPIGKCN